MSGRDLYEEDDDYVSSEEDEDNEDEDDSEEDREFEENSDEETDEEDEEYEEDPDDEGDYSDEEDDSEYDGDEEDENGNIEENSDEDEDEDEPEYEEDLVFVMMPYRDEHIQEVYTVIREECSHLRLKAQLAREGVGSGLVIQEISNLIQQAEFIICDLTDERPNVYYELGQAHGIGNDASRILLIAKEGTNLHFNVASLRVQYYLSMEHLHSIVRDNLKKMMEHTR